MDIRERRYPEDGNHTTIRFTFCILYHLCIIKSKKDVKKGTRTDAVELRHANKVVAENTKPDVRVVGKLILKRKLN